MKPVLNVCGSFPGLHPLTAIKLPQKIDKESGHFTPIITF